MYCKGTWFVVYIANSFQITFVFFSDNVLKMLVEMIGSQPKQNAVTALLLTRTLMLKYEWRVSFATEGGVKAILCCMQEYSTCIQVQQIALAVSENLCELNSYVFKGMRFMSFSCPEFHCSSR